MQLPRTPLFVELRERIVTEAKREDVRILVAWLLSNFTDDGSIRSLHAHRRKRLVLDGVTYWLVKVPSDDQKTPP
jgi:hypothetical protein